MEIPAGDDGKLDVFVDGERRDFHFRPHSTGDTGVIEQIFKNEDYEMSEFRLYPAFSHYMKSVQEGDRTGLIIDAGANIGASPIYFLSKFPDATVVAIEPERNNFRYLTRNCMGLNIIPVEGALGSRPGKRFLHDPGESDWGFRIADQGLYEVDIISVEQILEDFPPGRYSPLIMKIDIEGGEKELFSANFNWLEKIPVLIIELHDWMLPGEANSRNFLKAISSFHFDFLYSGENVFCFNNLLLDT